MERDDSFSEEEYYDLEFPPEEDNFECSVCKQLVKELFLKCTDCYTSVHLTCLIKSETVLTTNLYVSNCMSCRREITPSGYQCTYGYPKTQGELFERKLNYGELPVGSQTSDVLNPCFETIELLLHFGASPGILDCFRETVLHKAIRAENISVAKFFIEKFKFLVNCRVYRQETPLHFAARHGSLEIIRLLVKATQNIDAVDCIGQTPIFMAATRGDLEIMKYLHKKGSNIHKETCDGRTLLHRTLWHGHYEASKWLLENGLSLHHLDNRQVTPLMCALVAAHESILMLCKNWCKK